MGHVSKVYDFCPKINSVLFLPYVKLDNASESKGTYFSFMKKAHFMGQLK